MKMRSNLCTYGVWIALGFEAAVHDLPIHAATTDVLADFVDDEDIEIDGNGCHPGPRQRQVFFLALLHVAGGNRIELCRVVIGILHDRQTSHDLARFQHHAADAADDMFQSQLVPVHVIALRTGKFAETDRHHLEQAALDFAAEIGVPFGAVNQHDAIGFVGGAIHEGFDVVLRLTQRHHFQLADDGTAHVRSSTP